MFYIFKVTDTFPEKFQFYWMLSLTVRILTVCDYFHKMDFSLAFAVTKNE